MQCSLFGKLAAKRDFIAVRAPRAFLNAWEPWMQAGISVSRDVLEGAWHDAFLTAPIWRFWLGADLCGSTTIGAFMPSLDGSGRYYPLTLFAQAAEGRSIPPPDVDAQDDWFAAGEELLLSTLSKDLGFDTISSRLDDLSAPAVRPPRSPQIELSAPAAETVAAATNDLTFGELLGSLRAVNAASIYSAASFWWTVGGEEFAPQGLCCRRMPDPILFVSMLTGRFERAFAG